MLWWIGAPVQLILTLHVLRFWMVTPQVQLGAVHPAWFIPVVGNLVVPLAGTAHGPHSVNWFFYGVGLVYWLTLLPLVMHRLFLGGDLPARLVPTLAILVAPPAVAGLSWVRLGGDWADPLARILLAVTVFQLLLLATQLPQLRRAPFALSAWAYVFPLAAATSALLAAGGQGWDSAGVVAGAALLGLLSALLLALAVRTGVAVVRHEICRPEPA